jgi:hypothetical protein
MMNEFLSQSKLIYQLSIMSRKRKRKENPHLPTKFESHGFPKVAEPSRS